MYIFQLDLEQGDTTEHNIETYFINVFVVFPVVSSCVDRKSSDLGLGGMHREYLQTDCAINQVIFSHSPFF